MDTGFGGMGFLGAILLTFGGLGGIFIAAFTRLWKNPPVIRIEVNVPPEFKLVMQKQPANIETDKVQDIPISEEILAYISLESDSWAQEARKKRARALYVDVQNWDAVLRHLQLEDSSLERP